MKDLKISRVLISYYFLQLFQIGLSIVKIPLIISYCGVEFLGKFVVLTGVWQFILVLSEANRNYHRISKNGKARTLGTLLIKYWLTILSASILILGLYSFQILSGFYVIFGTLLTGFTIIAVKTAESFGKWEATGKLVSANILSIFGQVISFLAFVLTLKFNNVLLSFSFTVLGNLFPAILIYFFSFTLRKNTPQKNLDVDFIEISLKSFLSIQLLERASYVLDPLIIAHQIDFSAVASFSIYQKVLVAFSITPTALSSLTMRSGISTTSKVSVRKVKYTIYLSGILMSIFFLFLGKSVLQSLSHGKIQISFAILFLVVITGLIGTIANPTLTSSVFGKPLKMKMKATVVMTPLGLVITWILCPHIGIAASFLTSLTSSLVVFFLVLRSRKVGM